MHNPNAPMYSVRVPATRRFHVVVAIVALTTAGIAVAQPVAQPGTTLTFDQPDLRDRGTPFPAQAFNTGLCITSPTFPSTEPGNMGLALQGVTSILGARCNVFQYNEFSVGSPDGAVPAGAALLAEVSGRVRLGGVLAMIGAGRTKSAYQVDLLDVTDGEQNATVVASQFLGADELVGAVLDMSLGATVDVEGGFPYLGASGAFNLGIQLPIQVKRVDNTFEFGMHALVERGRVYRIQVSVAGALDVEIGAGLGFVLFPALGTPDQIPQLLDPQMWVDLLPFRSLSGANVCGLEIPDLDIPRVKELLPNLAFQIPKLDFSFPKLKVSLPEPIGSLTFTSGFDATILPQTSISIVDYQQAINLASDPEQLLTQLGLPSEATDLFSCFLDIATGQNPVLDEILPQIGIGVDDLSVTVDEDRIEAIDQFVLQQVNGILNQVDATSVALDGHLATSSEQFSADLGAGVSQLSSTVDTEFAARTQQLDTAVANLTEEITSQSDGLTEQVETAFADLNQNLDDTAARELRLEIERSLSGSDRHKVAQFILPEAFDGKLELVREIVAETIVAVQSAGLAGFDSEVDLLQGDAEYQAGEFKQAFRFYVAAYKNAVALLGPPRGDER